MKEINPVPETLTTNPGKAQEGIKLTLDTVPASAPEVKPTKNSQNPPEYFFLFSFLFLALIDLTLHT
ncbi:hypothetical protein MJO28_003887 [Puccinia striiformis f. sp. tritici]|uniref:Uncharacterized protein n=1 Tax=Puccinia striiformis f. sp. tritici TaxID=168172 RepID=A0ACC0EMH0_9BASI|nr:hypothetical protein MJO28_003887 [Puccinia striiformis f. sp. tritici]